MSSINLMLKAEPASWNSKLACATVLALVFLSGAAAGAVAMNLGVHNLLHQPGFDTAAGKTLYFDRLQRELNLSPAQSEQIQSVLNDFWVYYRTVLSDSKQRVEQLLNEEQKQKFERILQEKQPR